MRDVTGAFIEALFAVIALLVALMGLGMFMVAWWNPMGKAFITAITIDNETASALLVTPIGVTPGGSLTPLPVHQGRDTPRRARQRARLAIAAGQARTIYYDWGDHGLGAIVVERAGEVPRGLLLDPPLVGRRAPGDRLEITDATVTVPLDTNVQAAFYLALKEHRSPLLAVLWIWGSLTVCLLGCAAGWVFLRRCRVRLRRDPQHA